MDYVVHGASDRGRQREVNEDRIAHRLLPAGLLALVADGVGGHPGGAFASALVVEHVAQAAGRMTLETSPAEQLVALCSSANSALRQAQQAHRGYEHMATTVVALLGRGEKAALLHAGDSRCYRWRSNRLSLLTRDHTVAEQMVDDGTITAADAERTPYQHILTRGLGLSDSFEYSLTELALEPGDLYLLCSDGLSKPLSDGEIAAVLSQPQPEALLADALIAAANRVGGPDNISVVLIRCLESRS
jgi:serine/threonine protein phosphatase PrpC